MKRLNGYRIRLMLVGFVAAIVVCGGRAQADFTFGEPTNLGPVVNSQYHDQLPSISSDGLELYFMSRRTGGTGDWDIWVTKRETIYDPWAEPANIGSTVNSSGEDWAPCISADGLELYFEANRSGGHGDTDILVASRKTIDEPWGNPVNLGTVVNTSSRDGGPSISNDGLELYFKSNRLGGHGAEDLWVSKRPAKAEPWGSPLNLGPTVNGSDWDRGPSISTDGLVLFFSSTRAGGSGHIDLWLTSRETKENTWGDPVNLVPGINTSYADDGLSISADGRTLYFSDYHNAIRPGGYGGSDLWQGSIQPVVDLNGDGVVDSADMYIMVDHWGTDEPLCDIGPMPWGDGVVDVQDLIVLSEHLFEEVKEPTLIAHWKLDETEGDNAYDSAGDKAGLLFGGPVWQPTGGIVEGALEFDGIDDYVETDFVLSPADGEFSVFAWVKGGSAEQIIISQIDGTRGVGSAWLCTDPSDGRLITRLMHPPFSPLESESVITDGLWHHIGVVYDFDGLHRCLYLDGVEVAKDIIPIAPVGSDGGLYIGAGKNLKPGSLFMGLIDDVRIYDVALSAEKVESLVR